ADTLIRRLRHRFAPGGFLHYGQGKWYPGESLPRWAFGLYWRKEGKPIWTNTDLIASETVAQAATLDPAKRFQDKLDDELGVGDSFVIPAFEDPAVWIIKEGNLPENVSPFDPKIEDPEERARMIRTFKRGLTQPTGYVLPIQRWNAAADRPKWISELWP